MKKLENYKEEIHKCSKCGLCQASCPVYKVTGNDCSVSRGLFNMLGGVIKKDLKMSENINKYLNLCLKCNACSEFCPSKINITEIFAVAKSEYFRLHPFEKFISFLQNNILFSFLPNLTNIFVKKIRSKQFEKKVIYFGGCSGKVFGNNSVVKLFNNMQIEVIQPNFSCCGIALLMRGDLESFNNYINKFIKELKKYDIKDVIVNCAGCEKTLKNYINLTDSEENKTFLSQIKIRNIYEYIRENELKIRLKKQTNVTYHKPCNLENYQDVKRILDNIENLNYIEMCGYNECCGMNGLTNFKEFKIMHKIYSKKRKNIIKTKCKYVLSSCQACIATMNLYSFGKYKAIDLLDFLAKTSNLLD